MRCPKNILNRIISKNFIKKTSILLDDLMTGTSLLISTGDWTDCLLFCFKIGFSPINPVFLTDSVDRLYFHFVKRKGQPEKLAKICFYYYLI